MKAVDLSFVPRSTIQQNQSQLFSNQRSTGDAYADATNYVATELKKDMEANKLAKARELQKRILSEWNSSEGMFKNILTNDVAKARKASALLAPWNDELSKAWIDKANELERSAIKSADERYRIDTEASTKASELQAEKLKTDAEQKAKSEEAIAKAEKEAKEEAEKLANVDVVSQDYNNAMMALEAGTYPAWWKLKTGDGTNMATHSLPRPEMKPDEIRRALTSGAAKDFSQGSTIDARTQELGTRGAKAQAELESTQLGLSADKVESLDANKQLEEMRTGNGDLRFSRDTAKKIQDIRAKLYTGLAKIQDAKSSADMLLDILGDGTNPVKNYQAIASVVLFNKIIDPGAVVRESDFNIASKALGEAENISNIANRFTDGNYISIDGVKSLKSFISKIYPRFNEWKLNLEQLAVKEAKRVSSGKAVPSDVLLYSTIPDNNPPQQATPQATSQATSQAQTQAKPQAQGVIIKQAGELK
jgi:hypothetical protein